MNIYFLVEGTRSEKKVYPAWMSYLVPQLRRVHHVDHVTENTYYLFSAQGYPSILRHIAAAIEDMNTIKAYDYLAICLDADDLSVEERISEVRQVVNGALLKAKPVVVVQNRCLETWFLGNRKLCARFPNAHPFIEYKRFYDVSQNDPELMEKPPAFHSSISQFHAEYLIRMLREKRLTYSKKAVKVVCQPDYIQELQQRVQETPHLNTLRTFFDFCEHVRQQLSADS